MQVLKTSSNNDGKFYYVTNVNGYTESIINLY